MRLHFIEIFPFLLLAKQYSRIIKCSFFHLLTFWTCSHLPYLMIWFLLLICDWATITIVQTHPMTQSVHFSPFSGVRGQKQFISILIKRLHIAAVFLRKVLNFFSLRRGATHTRAVSVRLRLWKHVQTVGQAASFTAWCFARIALHIGTTGGCKGYFEPMYRQGTIS